MCDKQITSASSKFLDGCRDFNAKQINQDALIDLTVQLDFHNVLDAFHNVHNGLVWIISHEFKQTINSKNGAVIKKALID